MNAAATHLLDAALVAGRITLDEYRAIEQSAARRAARGINPLGTVAVALRQAGRLSAAEILEIVRGEE